MKRIHVNLYLIGCCFLWLSLPAFCQKKVVELSLSKAIEDARSQSLNALIATNSYIASYWQYRQFKASQKPALSLSSMPIQYYRNFVKRYDSQNNVDVYMPQKSLYSSADLVATQNFALTGGTFSLESDLGYLKNYGTENYTQFSSIPFRLGYSQSLFGYNQFKWDKQIEPMRFEKAHNQLIYELENVSATTTTYFFNFVQYQTNVQLAKENVAMCDTAYQIALERQKIGNTTQAEVLTLRLNLLNAKKNLKNTAIYLEQAEKTLVTFLRYDAGTKLHIIVPKPESFIMIPTDNAIELAKKVSPKIQELKIQELSAQQNLEQIKKSRYSASVSLSIGFNQAGNNFVDAYKKPLRQDVVSVSFNIPILDWGMNKGKIIVAENNLNTTILSNKQTIEDFEQDVFFAVKEYNESYEQIDLANEAEHVARQAYEDTFQRFMIGKADVDALNMAQSRLSEAGSSYINALSTYWNNYYKVRQLTLYDFSTQKPIDIDVSKFEEH